MGISRQLCGCVWPCVGQITSQMGEEEHCEPTSQMGDNGGSVAEVGLADCKAGPGEERLEETELGLAV